MAGPMRVDDDYVQIRFVERKIVIAAIPHYDVSFLFYLTQDPPIIYSSIDYVANVDMRLEFLTLFDGALKPIHIIVRGIPFNDPCRQIPVRHRMANDDHSTPTASTPYANSSVQGAPPHP